MGLLFTIAVPPLFPSVKLYYFIPFLVRCFYLKSLNTALLMALFIGFLVDLFSTHSRFGLYAANYVITTYFLYGLKKNFFEDNLSTLPFMTFFFSLFSSILHYFLIILLSSQTIPLSFAFIFVDFLLMPALDSLFAVSVFTLPAYFFGKPIRKGSDYFLQSER